ncbi:hypothetical protein K32_30800 [Kaistia sp. 32K]|nr:hypothetical protein K32_30800 [Kaistia sp. 32K]
MLPTWRLFLARDVAAKEETDSLADSAARGQSPAPVQGTGVSPSDLAKPYRLPPYSAASARIGS